MLADVKIVPFHFFLGVLDGPTDHAMGDGLVLLHAQGPHDSAHALAAENPQKIVFQGQIKTGTAGVPLPSGTTAQLVVDASALVSLRTKDVQTAQFHHPLAEYDIGPPAGHVGGNGNRPLLAGIGHDLGLLAMALGVEHIMPDTVFL